MPRLQQDLPAKPAHVEAAALFGSGLLIEPVLVAATRAAHKNFSPHLFAEIIRQVHDTGAEAALPPGIAYLAFELPHYPEDDLLLGQARALPEYGARRSSSLPRVTLTATAAITSARASAVMIRPTFIRSGTSLNTRVPFISCM